MRHCSVKQIYGYYEATLPDSEHSTVQEHIARCVSCQDQLQRLHQLNQHLDLLNQQLHEPPSPEWLRIEERLHSRLDLAELKRIKRNQWLAPLGIIALSVILVFVMVWPRPPLPVLTANPIHNPIHIYAGRDLHLELSSQTTITLFQGTQGRIGPLDDTQLVVELDTGQLVATFKRGIPFTHMSVEAGDIAVAVKGTTFAVQANQETVAVHVLQGRVAVTGPRPGMEEILVGRSQTVHIPRAFVQHQPAVGAMSAQDGELLFGLSPSPGELDQDPDKVAPVPSRISATERKKTTASRRVAQDTPTPAPPTPSHMETQQDPIEHARLMALNARIARLHTQKQRLEAELTIMNRLLSQASLTHADDYEQVMGQIATSLDEISQQINMLQEEVAQIGAEQ